MIIIDFSLVKGKILSGLKQAGLAAFQRITQHISAHDLFTITVIFMIVGHVVSYLYNNNPEWLRIPDRVLLPVFLISVGFNSGLKPRKVLLFAAFLPTVVALFFLSAFRLFTPATILFVLFILEPFMNFLIKGSLRFWGVSLLLMLLIYHSHFFLESGTMVLIFAMCGWLNVNRSIVSEKVVRPWEFYIFTYFTYFIFVRLELRFTLLENLIFAVLLCFSMYLMYDFRPLLLNSIRNRPKYLISKFWRYVGRRSLDIYILQQAVILILYGFFVR